MPLIRLTRWWITPHLRLHEAIALTSELLSEVMMYHEEENQLFSREIELVKKLVTLVSLFRDRKT